MSIRIDDFITSCASLTSEMTLSYQELAPSIEFSNTGRRGGCKYFSITLRQLSETLTDILTNLAAFEQNSDYVEGTWRTLFSTHISNNVVNALSTVQTLPLYALINKVLTVANQQDDYKEKSMSLTEESLTTAIAYLDSQLPNDQAYLQILGPQEIVEDQRVKTGFNKIYYGAPGTGKSHTIDKSTSEQYSMRTVFHPDTQYNDFVGSLKPVMFEDKVRYEFRPGSFTNALLMAINNPEYPCTLIIEEINRASASAAFGEVFQLLDRTKTCESKYSIDISDPDWLEYLNKNSGNYFPSKKLKIPSNLTILATMNSSDQAVMPLDTAFKRRWIFEYLPLDYSNAANGTLPLPLDTPKGEVETKQVKWKDFAKTINEALAEDHIPEDKLLGHRFLDDLELNENGKNALKGKLFMYLWDDVLRHGQRGTVFADYIEDNGHEVELTTYGQLIKAYDAGNSILRESISETLYQLTSAQEEQA